MNKNGDKLAITMSDAKNIIEKTEILEQEFSENKSQLEDALAEIAILNERSKVDVEKIETLQSEIASFSEENEALEKNNEELKAQIEKLTQEEARVEVKVIEELQDIGVTPVSLTAEGVSVDHIAEFQAITDPIEKTKYYRKHKAQILGGKQ